MGSRAYKTERILAEQMQVLSHSSKIYTLLHRITLEITRLGKKKIKILEPVFCFKGFTRFLAELY